jgi:hypothetical protein
MPKDKNIFGGYKSRWCCNDMLDIEYVKGSEIDQNMDSVVDFFDDDDDDGYFTRLCDNKYRLLKEYRTS